MTKVTRDIADFMSSCELLSKVFMSMNKKEGKE
jgi:hypothetical protein